ncbi:hypothetical protein KVG88_30370 [Pseudomonas sp. SWRI74]|uniref:DUF2612 domain-containing protein n=1 Tax=Pseudomonas azerbaijanoccidentalis TaxID=2842347 RepID=A0ABS6R0H3_9PSED|nr:hypothetical protein [Pseudomonas azerbaijanoccidentalis]MBV4524382.1 hypothetical protein [Pseudomonas azerbaijanoccidentalis]
MQLIPLQRSAEYDEIESEFKALFLSLYHKDLSGHVVDANTLGMPHLGPDAFISRGLNNDGLALLNDTTSDMTRMLFMAWRYLNPQRGTKFLAFYLRSLFGDVFTIDQLWCEKGGEYPVDVMTENEIQLAGRQLSDYFLTSRLRVDIETEIVPERILAAARTAVAARFVLDLRAARRAGLKIPIACIAYGFNIGRVTGTALYQQPVIESYMTVGPGIKVTGATLAFSSIDRLDMQTFTK